MIRRLLFIFVFILSAIPHSSAQNYKKDFQEAFDSLFVLLHERTSVSVEDLESENVIKNGNTLHFRFSAELSDYPWTEANYNWFRETLTSLFPEKYSHCTLGNVTAHGVNINTLITPELSNDGFSSDYKYRYKDHRPDETPLVTRVGARNYSKGLSGRHIALWQSHGRYYETAEQRWEWQRAPLHRTVEDMFTQSLVLPYLIPMLENAGAYVMTPRERDTQRYEVIIDNDPSFQGRRTGLTRRSGNYLERGQWTDAGVGFADAKEFYVKNENPFTMGSARKIETSTEEKGRKAEARYEFEVPESGYYAVYVSYTSFKNSAKDAHYEVHYFGGTAEFKVNQRMGGGTWIYLGTFPFMKGRDGHVVVDNISEFRNWVVSTDAVKIGGGMGKIARGEDSENVEFWNTSGMPAYMEGALYWEQFAGIDSTVTRNWEGDYTQDFASRGAWVSHMAGGSRVNPKEEDGKKIPFDLSFAFHSDAGVYPNDSLVGTLSIYTLKADGKSVYADGRSRELGRHLAGTVQEQVVRDIRADYDSLWARRQLWNKSYSESRTTSVPGMILEFLSHQNFADMKYGLDPSFRFTVSRAVYKGMLKFLSDEYGVPYTVQPLPVNSLSAQFISDSDVMISWKATEDKKEPTAVAERFLLSTRIDDGFFSDPVGLTYVSDKEKMTANSYTKEGDRFYTIVSINPNEIYSFRILAENEGGRSFPSETMSVGRSSKSKGTVMVVNKFDRVSAPSWYDSADYAGFASKLDSGVPYISDISYIGENYEFRRNLEWTDDDNAGFGATDSDHAGDIIPGNTFDFIKVHGRSLMNASYSFCSSSADAYESSNGILPQGWLLDIICGKQITSMVGNGNVPAKFSIYTDSFINAVKQSLSEGHNLILSGAYIGTDANESIYPMQLDSLYIEKARDFVSNTLGFQWITNHGTVKSQSVPFSNEYVEFNNTIPFRQELNTEAYWVENPDGIKPSSKDARTIMKYAGSDISSAVARKTSSFRSVCIGFPLECISDSEILDSTFETILGFLTD